MFCFVLTFSRWEEELGIGVKQARRRKEKELKRIFMRFVERGVL